MSRELKRGIMEKLKGILTKAFNKKPLVFGACIVMLSLVLVLVVFFSTFKRDEKRNELAADEVETVSEENKVEKSLELETVSESESPSEEITTETMTESLEDMDDGFTLVTNKTGSSYLSYDNEGPVFLNSSEVHHIAGESFDLDKLVSYGDYYDPCPNLSYSGYINPDSVGTYPIKVKASDASGNSTYKDLTVHVVNEKKSDPDTRPRIPYADFITNYDNGSVHFGIDVSRWQGDIDFNACKAAGCEFVIIRIGGWDGDELYTDSKYYYNISAAKAAGLKVGVYFHSNDNTAEGMHEHTAALIGLLNGVELDFPVAFDWESWSRFQKYNMSFEELNQLFYIFHDDLDNAGYESMLYGSKYYLENFWDNVYNYPVWLANYTDQTSYAGSYCIWQLSDRGRIAGIDSDVDLDIYYGSFE